MGGFSNGNTATEPWQRREFCFIHTAGGSGGAEGQRGEGQEGRKIQRAYRRRDPRLRAGFNAQDNRKERRKVQRHTGHIVLSRGVIYLELSPGSNARCGHRGPSCIAKQGGRNRRKARAERSRRLAESEIGILRSPEGLRSRRVNKGKERRARFSR